MIVYLYGCTDLDGPATTQEPITLSKTVTILKDSTQSFTATGTLTGDSNYSFQSVESRIAWLSCSSPSFIITAFSGTDSAIEDTLYMTIHALNADVQDTLFKTSQSIVLRHEDMTVNNFSGSPFFVYYDLANMLDHAPYAFTYNIRMHFTGAVQSVDVRIDIPTLVNYLN
jgi:hypothetical protein